MMQPAMVDDIRYRLWASGIFEGPKGAGGYAVVINDVCSGGEYASISGRCTLVDGVALMARSLLEGMRVIPSGFGVEILLESEGLRTTIARVLDYLKGDLDENPVSSSLWDHDTWNDLLHEISDKVVKWSIIENGDDKENYALCLKIARNEFLLAAYGEDEYHES